MKTIVALTLFTLLLAGCFTNNVRVTAPEAMTGINNAIESTAKVTAVALRQDRISIKQACAVQQYGSLALSINTRAWDAWVAGDPQKAEEHVRAAREALSGVSKDAAKLVADHCGGNP